MSLIESPEVDFVQRERSTISTIFSAMAIVQRTIPYYSEAKSNPCNAIDTKTGNCVARALLLFKILDNADVQTRIIYTERFEHGDDSEPSSVHMLNGFLLPGYEWPGLIENTFERRDLKWGSKHEGILEWIDPTVNHTEDFDDVSVKKEAFSRMSEAEQVSDIYPSKISLMTHHKKHSTRIDCFSTRKSREILKKLSEKTTERK